MIKSIPLYIGLRYMRSGRSNRFISFISLSAVIGIGLGVAVLITVLSVMNGFDDQIRKQVFSLARQITVTQFSDPIVDWQSLERSIQHTPGVLATEPFVSGQGMLTYAGKVHPVLAMGILPDKEAELAKLGQQMTLGRLSDLKPGGYGIILGEELANSLGVYLGDKITLVTADPNLTPAGVILRSKRFTVVGLFQAGGGFGFDTLWGFIHLKDAQTLFKTGQAVTGIWASVKNVYDAPLISHRIWRFLPKEMVVSDWTQEYGAFFQAIHLEKTMMSLVLLLLVAIATFNLVAGLVMLVNDKRGDIAILRTLGARPCTIMAIFIVQGSLIGLIGTLLGIAAGIAISLHVTQIVNLIEHVLHVKLISSSVYYVDFLPSRIQTGDILWIAMSALIMSFIATLYPARRAARIQPAEALRYE